MFTELSFPERAGKCAHGRSKVFIEGYSQATMDRVAEAAGVNKRTVYKHFRSKPRALQRRRRWNLDENNSVERGVDGSPGDPRVELKAFATEMLEQLLHPHKFFLFFEWRPQDSCSARILGVSFTREPAVLV